jgi:glycerol uptake facilitator protein
MSPYVGEIIGTAILIILGDGVVANVLLKESKAFDAGWMVIASGWGLAVAIAVFAVNAISGAHINPAVTLGLAISGQFPWAKVPGYVGCQMLGAFIGAVIVWIHFYGHWAITPDPLAKRNAFCTSPALRSVLPNLLSEIIGTFMLVYGVFGLLFAFGDKTITNPGLNSAFLFAVFPFIVGVLVWAIGLSLGGPTGYAINPARDLGPRIAHAILPIPGKGSSDWGYAWIPVAGPLIGGALAALLYQVTFANATPM